MNFGLASERAGIFRGVNKLRPEFSVTFADKNKLPKTFGISVCDTFPVFCGSNDVETLSFLSFQKRGFDWIDEEALSDKSKRN